MEYSLMTNNEDETKLIAEKITAQLKPGNVITLEGDLGAGKTTFTKGIGQALGVKRAITSPTFTIVKEYKGTMPLYHMDAYRLEDSDEDIGFDEYFYGEGISIIEWPSFIEDYLPTERLHIKIEFVAEQIRKMTFFPKGKHYETIVRQLLQQD